MIDVVTIASLCPWAAEIRRPHFTPETHFWIPAVPRGAPPATKVIKDQVQWEQILSIRPPMPTTIRALDIANDFILHTTLMGPHMTEDARPAIWICQGPGPSEEECIENLVKLEQYCGLVVEEADELDRRRRNNEPAVVKITQRMKDAARFLNLKRDWLTTLVNSSTACPFCTQIIPQNAIKCPMCGEVVNKAKYTELKSAKPVEAAVAIS